MRGTVTVVDYGVGNLFSVGKALEAVGSRVVFSSDPQAIRSAERLVFPGVGAFASAMQALHSLNLVEALHDYVALQRPMLAICLGMQMLFESSEEFGVHQGLGFFAGNVVSIKTLVKKPVRVPHIGWSAISFETSINTDETVFRGVKQGECFYFVHSFAAQAIADQRLGTVAYGGVLLSAAVHKDAITGVQFHPEKSGPSGLRLLENFTKKT